MNKRPRSTLSATKNGSRSGYMTIKKLEVLSIAAFVGTVHVTNFCFVEPFRCHSFLTKSTLVTNKISVLVKALNFVMALV